MFLSEHVNPWAYSVLQRNDVWERSLTFKCFPKETIWILLNPGNESAPVYCVYFVAAFTYLHCRSVTLQYCYFNRIRLKEHIASIESGNIVSPLPLQYWGMFNFHPMTWLNPDALLLPWDLKKCNRSSGNTFEALRGAVEISGIPFINIPYAKPASAIRMQIEIDFRLV